MEIITKYNQTQSIDDTYEYFLTKSDEITTKLDVVSKNYIRLLVGKYCKNERLDNDDLKSLLKNLKILESTKEINVLYKLLPEVAQNPTKTKDQISSKFVLLFTTKHQDIFLKENNVNTLLIDTTFGTNMYNYRMIIGLTLKHYSESVPIFYIISSDERETTLLPCFGALKNKYEKLKITYLTSDLAPNFYNAICHSYGSQTHWLWCEWHFVNAVHRKIHNFD